VAGKKRRDSTRGGVRGMGGKVLEGTGSWLFGGGFEGGGDSGLKNGRLRGHLGEGSYCREGKRGVEKWEKGPSCVFGNKYWAVRRKGGSLVRLLS